MEGFLKLSNHHCIKRKTKLECLKWFLKRQIRFSHLHLDLANCRVLNGEVAYYDEDILTKEIIAMSSPVLDEIFIEGSRVDPEFFEQFLFHLGACSIKRFDIGYQYGLSKLSLKCFSDQNMVFLKELRLDCEARLTEHFVARLSRLAVNLTKVRFNLQIWTGFEVARRKASHVDHLGLDYQIEFELLMKYLLECKLLQHVEITRSYHEKRVIFDGKMDAKLPLECVQHFLMHSVNIEVLLYAIVCGPSLRFTNCNSTRILTIKNRVLQAQKINVESLLRSLPNLNEIHAFGEFIYFNIGMSNITVKKHISEELRLIVESPVINEW
jgi:uncharacterized pyridoxamine 5'-phosphate oxidase family protein